MIFKLQYLTGPDYSTYLWKGNLSRRTPGRILPKSDIRLDIDSARSPLEGCCACQTRRYCHISQGRNKNRKLQKTANASPKWTFPIHTRRTFLEHRCVSRSIVLVSKFFRSQTLVGKVWNPVQFWKSPFASFPALTKFVRILSLFSLWN